MDMHRQQVDHPRMARKPQDRFKVLYIGAWLTKLGRKQGEVAKKAGIDVGYMSQLVSGEKNNPSSAQTMAIAEELGITVNHLYHRPPEHDVTGPARLLTPEQVQALRALLPPDDDQR